MIGRMIPVRYVLSSILIYLLSNTSVLKMCHFKLEHLFRCFLWGSLQGDRGVHILAWEVLCQPVRDGDLGIQLLVVKHEALITRHATRFLFYPNSIWSSLIATKYGLWTMMANIKLSRSNSFMWREICAYAIRVMT